MAKLKTKQSEAKPPLADMMQDFHLALLEVAKVTRMGNLKHGSLGSWRTVPDFKRVYMNANARHAMSALIESADGESGLSHRAHEAWNCLALLQWELEGGAEVDGESG